MKKIILASTFILLGLVSEAQITYGPTAGMNIVNLKGKDADIYDIEAMLGFHGGVFLNVPVSSRLSIKPEIMFVGVSGKQDYSGFKASFNLNYFSLPVVMQYKLKSGFWGEFGPQMDFLVSSKGKVDGISQDISGQFTFTNFSAVIGAGYTHSSGIGANVRYSLGLSKIAEDGSDVKTDVVSIGLLYHFKVGGKSKK